MCDNKIRVFRLDDDELVVLFYYDSEYNMYFGEYPDFTEEPRLTPNGRPWMNATNTECPYSSENYNDCGSCKYFLKEEQKDIIGICINEAKLIID